MLGKYIKFDDVILPELTSQDRSANVLQKIGREMAVIWMLPRPKDMVSSNFDFEAALDRFGAVVKSFDSNGMKTCVQDEPRGSHTPKSFQIKPIVERQVKELFQQFKFFLKEQDQLKILRTALYLCLLSGSKYLFIHELDQFLPIFEALRLCGELLFDPGQISVTIEGEIQNQVVDALKKLVKDFVNLQVSTWGNENLADRGNWLYAIPFIHQWDLSGEKTINWLHLKTWIQNLRTT